MVSINPSHNIKISANSHSLYLFILDFFSHFFISYCLIHHQEFFISALGSISFFMLNLNLFHIYFICIYFIYRIIMLIPSEFMII